MKQRDGFRKEMQVGGKRKRLEGVEKQSNKRAAETTYHCVKSWICQVDFKGAASPSIQDWIFTNDMELEK